MQNHECQPQQEDAEGCPDGEVHQGEGCSQEGEPMLLFLQRMSTSQVLLGPGSLREALWKDPQLSTSQIGEGWILQYQLAVLRQDKLWIRLARQECVHESGAAWVDSNLPSLDGSLMPKQGGPSHTSGLTPSEVSGAEICRDARLAKDPSIPFHRDFLSSEEPERCLSPEDNDRGVGSSESTVPEAMDVEEDSDHDDTLDLVDGGVDDTEFAPELSLDPEYGGFDVGDCSLEDNPEVCLPETGPVKSGSNEEKEDNPISGGTPSEEPEINNNNSGVCNLEGTCKSGTLLEATEPVEEASTRLVSVGASGGYKANQPELKVTVEYGESSESVTNSGGDVEGSVRGSVCPVVDCGETVVKLFRHVNRRHIPPLFRLNSKGVTAELLDKKEKALKELVEAALGQGATLRDAVDFVNSSGDIPETSEMALEVSTMLLSQWKSRGWVEPEKLSIRPVNSPLALFHWRCLVILLKQLSPEVSARWQETGLVTQSEPMTGEGHPPPLQNRKKKSQERESEKQMWLTIQILNRPR